VNVSVMYVRKRIISLGIVSLVHSINSEDFAHSNAYTLNVNFVHAVLTYPL
jgi:hypothetical protein